MTREQVRTYIEDGIKLLSTNLGFNSGRITEFNSERSNGYPFAWLESLSVSSDIPNQTPIDTWSIVIHIAQKDAMDSKPDDYEAIVDVSDYIAQQLQKKYNAEVSGFKLITMEGMTREPFIKKHADCLTGVIFSFNLIAPDTANFC